MRIPVLSSVRPVLACLALGTGAVAQQFQQATNFPGAALWSEGVECADVDRDGDLDVFVADGDGFNSAGVQRQSRLFMNQTVQGTPYGLVDESVARLGAHSSNAKGVTTGDVDGDGWVDALFANAFSTQPPFLYVNQGGANPGFFTFDGIARGFTASYSSGAAMFGDLDDDGDLDVILNDRYNTVATGRPHLFFNDGTGHFTENAAALNAPLKNLQMDVQLVDVDGDWDLDFFGPNKSITAPAHYLLLNNGAGTFTDASALITAASGNSYEAEAGDLDGDQDLDLFFLSLAGQSEAAVRNNFAPSGTLSFTNQPAFSANDDNEVVLFDYDVDGDYDVLVGSLRAGSEKLFRNDGAFAFNDQSAQVQNTSDATLDATAADLNNDGKYDLVTVQGESGSYVDKFLRNTGAADTLPPVVLATRQPAGASAAGPWRVQARVRDQVIDDGVDYVSGSASCVVQAAVSEAAVSIVAGGAFSMPSLAVPTGTRVTWTNASGSLQNVRCLVAPYAFDSGSLANGATYDSVLVEPGAYVFTNSMGGATCTVTVSGTTSAGTWRKSGAQLQRFTFADTLSGAGVRVCWELRVRDWPGNVRAVTGSFDVTPVPSGTDFCPGDGTATVCPCGNAGGAGRGCASSVEPAGALLSAAGGASLSADTLVLSGSGMPNSFALYFQGTAQQNGGLGVAFGDGLRCASGSVMRLSTKLNAAGASTYPAGGDPTISVRGGIGAPGIRTYQVWYRNAAAFCTASTFNLSNGLEIAWGA